VISFYIAIFVVKLKVGKQSVGWFIRPWKITDW